MTFDKLRQDWWPRVSPYAVYIIIGALCLWAVIHFTITYIGVGVGLKAVQESGTLVVATIEGPTTLYEGREGGPTGYEYDLTRALAKDLGVDIKYRKYSSIADVLNALRDEQAHIAAAGLTRTPSREEEFLFSPAYQTVKETVICRRGVRPVKNFEDLAEMGIYVERSSSYAERLEALNAALISAGKAPVEWRTSRDPVETLLAEVAESDIPCTVADTPILRVNRRLYPVLEPVFDLTPEIELAWAMPQKADDLAAYLENWFSEKRKIGLLARLDNRYFDYFPEFDYVDISRYRRDIEEKLPDYEDYIHDAADEFGLPWQLLAAISYQESRWDPAARSHTGVRGFMMLTQTTARRVGVEDRLDAEESIRGGAQYFAELVERIPEDVKGTDRYWFALAAYNMGMGHLYDARRLAVRRGLDKGSWVDLREVLPLLMEPAHYKTLPHGYARGREARRFVSQVRSYLHILEGMS